MHDLPDLRASRDAPAGEVMDRKATVGNYPHSPKYVALESRLRERGVLRGDWLTRK